MKTDDRLNRCAAKLVEWHEQKRYGIVEIHFQAGKITHVKEITSTKLDEPIQ